MQENLQFDVNLLREKETNRIREAVKKAYENRKIVTIAPGAVNSDENLKEAKATHSWLSNKKDTEIITVETLEDEAHVVSVTNPHDYPVLITLALETLAEDGYFDSEQMHDTVQRTLKHEFEHHVPGLGHDGLIIKYCIAFSEDPSRDVRGVQPFINLSGTFDVGLYRQILGAPERKSETDKIQLKKKRFNLKRWLSGN